MTPHKPGLVAQFISCDDRKLLDTIKAREEKKTGYPISYRALLHAAIEALNKVTR